MAIKTKPDYIPTTPELKEACEKLLTVYEKPEDFVLPVKAPKLIDDVINALCKIMNHRWVEWQYDEGLDHIFVTDVLFCNATICLEGFQVCHVWGPHDNVLKPVEIQLDHMFTFAKVIVNSSDWTDFYNCPKFCTKKEASQYTECENLEESERLINESAIIAANHLLALSQSE